MPALAMMVISLSTMPCSFSQYASVPATSRNGRPDENPKKNIVHAAGCEKDFHTDGRFALTGGAGDAGAALFMDGSPARRERGRRIAARGRLRKPSAVRAGRG